MISGKRFSSLLVLVSIVWVGALPSSFGQVPVDVSGPAVQTDVYNTVYRPSSAEYRIHSGDRFDLIYQVGTEEMVRRTQNVLEETWAETDSLIGTVDADFATPVVINGYSDRGNGFVEPFPFRQEIHGVNNKKNQLGARSSSWPAFVASHELVHSAHLDADGGVGVGGAIRLFAPDHARAWNGTAPRGLVEGVAVYRESQVEEGAGRLNAPLFTMKMKAAMLSEDPWSFTQMLEDPVYTQPFNRHYIGGGHAFQYLAERGDSTDVTFFRDAVKWHNRFPFLGHGVWMGFSTGQFPHEINSELQNRLRQSFREELKRRAPFTPARRIAAENGVNYRRPYWLDDETLVAYVHGYDVRAGFYKIDVSTGERTPIRIQTLTEDRVYTVASDTSALYASRYVTNPLVRDQQIAEVERVDLSTGTARRVTKGGRAFAPAEGPNGNIHTATNDGPFSRWSIIDSTGAMQSVTPNGPTRIRQIAPAPNRDVAAVIINAEGDQRIYRATGLQNADPDIEPWIGLKKSIVYDISWGPEGRYLLFAADYPETANIFAFDTETQRILQLANVRFGALEPSLSPDRSTVAFVNYLHEQHQLVSVPFRPDSASVVRDSDIRLHGSSPRHEVLNTSPNRARISSTRSYSAWRHLTPRMVYPSLHMTGDDFDFESVDELSDTGVGLTVAGADPLKRWAYRGSAYWQDGALWGEAGIESGRYLLRPSMEIFDRTIRLSGSSPGIEERGIGMGMRLPVTLQSNVYQSLLRFGFDTELRQIRFYGGGLGRPTEFSRRLTLNPSVVFGYRLQQNPRDLVPNTGLVLGVGGEFDTWVDPGQTSISARRGITSGLSIYMPFLRESHTGIRVGAGLLTQNQPTFSTSTFVPRGYDGLASINQVTRASGTFLRFDVEVTQPLWYIDEGVSVLPVYAKALSVYGFGETFGRVTGNTWEERASSIGAGLSLRIRFFYLLDFDLRFGGAFRFGPNDAQAIYR